MEDSVVLSYHDSLLRKSDINLLSEGGWLNDRLIGFWFEYLHNEIYSCDPSILLVSAEVTHFLKLSGQEEVNLFTEPLELAKKKLVLFPINDSMSFDCPGGNHWSLLVFDAQSKIFYHLDSWGGLNHSHALKLSRKLGLSSMGFAELSSCQQNNGSDCGLFVCCNAEHVLKHKFLNENAMDTLPLLEDIVVLNFRERMRTLINNLSKSHV